MQQYLRLTRHRFFKRHIWRTRFTFWGGAILVGCVAAFFAIVADHADHFFRAIVAYNKYLPLIISPLGLVATAFFTRRYFAGSEGSGIPQALVAMKHPSGALSQRLLSMRLVVGKILMCLLGLLSGASIGREGPTVHLGAAVMYSLGRYAHIPGEYLERGLIMAGGGAGIAAAFNTPLAGIIFTIEELARSFDRRNSSLIVIAVILAGMTALVVHEHNYDYYGVIPAKLDFSWVWLGVIACGISGGFMGGGFSQMLVSGSKWLAPHMRRRWVLIALACGFGIAILGLISNGLSYGTGYIEASSIVSCAGKTSCHADVGFMYPLYKLFATVVSYLSGIPGGIFAPSLAAGAGLGSDFAILFPATLTSTIVVLGMVAYFSGVVQAPITAFVIVMEMTDNHNLVLAMMATSLLASGTSKLICPKPIYHALAENFVRALAQEKLEQIEKPESETVEAQEKT
jgi:H+/Cl- antiporter ClcA